MSINAIFEIMVVYLKGTYFKLHMRNGEIDPLSYVYWSWGQDYEEYDITDTTSNCAESCNSRLNRSAPKSYQKIYSSAKHIWDSHRRVLDKYCSLFKYNRTPTRKRKKTTTARWEFLTAECNAFHSLGYEGQTYHLITYLIRCADPTEPPEKPEIDPCKDL